NGVESKYDPQRRSNVVPRKDYFRLPEHQRTDGEAASCIVACYSEGLNVNLDKSKQLAEDQRKSNLTFNPIERRRFREEQGICLSEAPRSCCPFCKHHGTSSSDEVCF